MNNGMSLIDLCFSVTELAVGRLSRFAIFGTLVALVVGWFLVGDEAIKAGKKWLVAEDDEFWGFEFTGKSHAHKAYGNGAESIFGSLGGIVVPMGSFAATVVIVMHFGTAQ